MRKRIFSLILMLLMVLTLLPIPAKAAGEWKLGFRWVNTENGVGTIDMSGEINTESLDVFVDTGSIIALYLVDENGNESPIDATKVTSGSTNVTVWASNEVAGANNVVTLQYGTVVEDAALQYAHTENGSTVNYEFPVRVGIAEAECFSGTSWDDNSKLDSFAVTDTADTFYIVLKDPASWKMESVELDQFLTGEANVTIDASGSYAAVKVTGNPPQDMYYSFNIHAKHKTYTTITRESGAQVRLLDHKTALRYGYVDMGTQPPTAMDGLMSVMDLEIDQYNDIYVYYTSGGASTKVSPGSLASSDTGVVTVSAHEDYPDVTVLKAKGFGSAVISYQANGQTYSFDVNVKLPQFGFYQSATANESNYITQFTVTDAGPNQIYLVSQDMTMKSLELNNGFEDIAGCTISQDGSYGVITINGIPENRNYNVRIVYEDAYGANQEYYASIELINHKSSLMLRVPGFPNGYPQEDTNNMLESKLEMRLGTNEPFYFYLIQNGNETKAALGDLSSSNESVVVVTQYEGSDAIVLEPQSLGTANIQYTKADGTVYTLPVTVDVMEVGCYTKQPTVTNGTVNVNKNDYVTEYTVTDTDHTLYIVQREGFKIVSVTPLRELAQIANAQVASDGSHATLTITGNPDGLNYDYQVWIEDPNGQQVDMYGNITLLDGRPYLGYCWPEPDSASGHGPIERYLNTAVGYDTDVWVYLVDGNQETLIPFADLKSTDESVLKVVDPRYEDGMVNFLITGWGQAAVTYTKNGKTYSIDIESELQPYGYYLNGIRSQENWIRGFTVTDDNNTFYYIAQPGVTLDSATPTPELAEIAATTLSSDKSMITITVTGTPKEQAVYGFDFVFTDEAGDTYNGNDYLDFIRKLDVDGDVTVDVDKLPIVDPSSEVQEVTAGVEKTEAQKVLQNTTKKYVEAIASGNFTVPLSEEVINAVHFAMANAFELDVTTSVSVENLKKETADASAKRDMEAIQKALRDVYLAQFMDITVSVSASVNGDVMASGTVSELEEPLRFGVVLPEELKKVPQGHERLFFVVYVHDGVVKSIPATVGKDDMVYFDAREFSTYSLVYRDVPTSSDQGESTVQPSVQAPTQITTVTSAKTGDTSSTAGFTAVLLASAAGVTALIRKKRRVQ